MASLEVPLDAVDKIRVKLKSFLIKTLLAARAVPVRVAIVLTGLEGLSVSQDAVGLPHELLPVLEEPFPFPEFPFAAAAYPLNLAVTYFIYHCPNAIYQIWKDRLTLVDGKAYWFLLRFFNSFNFKVSFIILLLNPMLMKD